MKALVLLSGGADSATCLGLAVAKYGAAEVCALSVYYGQTHEKELEAAQKIAAFYGVDLKKTDLSAVFAGSDCPLIAGSHKDIPAQSYAEQLKDAGGKPVATYVPFRNGLFLSVAASAALISGCKEIYYGAHGDDAAGNAYPDCSESFNAAMGEAVYIGSGGRLKIIAPFVKANKAYVIKRGIKLGVPYEFTRSCYAGGEKPCGVCGTCRDRAAAFKLNGIEDPALKNG